MQRIQILNLYRAKLKVCRSIGYSYGNWDNQYLYGYTELTTKNIKELINRNLLAPFIWNNVRFQYKKKNTENIENAIDSGFSLLRRINYARVLNNRKNILPSGFEFIEEDDEDDYYEGEEDFE